MLYRYETHLHCVQCSNCARSASTEYIKAYRDAGYAGMVLTDHFVLGSTCVREDEGITWEARMHCYYDAYLAAKAVGDTMDFDVIFGIEHECGNKEEALCYGIDLDFLLANPDIPELSWQEFSDRVHAYGGILIQAHPFRKYPDDPTRVLPESVVDGLELYNAGNKPIENERVIEVARKRGGILTAGSDTHRVISNNIAKAGITLPYRIKNEKELVAALKRGDHGLYINGENCEAKA